MTGDVREGLNETRQEAPGEPGAEVEEMRGRKDVSHQQHTHLNEARRSVSTNGPITTSTQPRPDECSHAFKSWRVRMNLHHVI